MITDNIKSNFNLHALKCVSLADKRSLDQTCTHLPIIAKRSNKSTLDYRAYKDQCLVLASIEFLTQKSDFYFLFYSKQTKIADGD